MGGDQPDSIARLEEMATQLAAHTQPSVLTRIAQFGLRSTDRYRAGQPELVILDEPTASLDRASAISLVEVLAGAASTGSTLVIATHDALVIEAGNVIAELDHGRRIR